MWMVLRFEEQKQVLQCIHTYYRNLFKRTSNFTIRQSKTFINDLNLPVLTSELSDLCEGLLHSSECYQSLISMPSNKTPGNDGITKEFYVAFYHFINKYFIDSANYSFRVGELSPSQKQAVITLLEKKDKDKRLIKNWRPISLLNVDAKIISKVWATRLKKVISFLVTSDQTAYIRGRFIGENVHLISDMLDYTDAAQLEGYIFAADMEKAFDSVDHSFIIVVLKAYGFGPNFVQWVKTLLYDQKRCVMNNGHSTGYFNLERGTRQGDPISAFLFPLTIEVLFIMVRCNVSIRGLSIFYNEIRLTACADDTTIFIKDLNSFYHLIRVFDQFRNFSSLKLNMEKSVLCGMGVLKGVQVAFCGCKVVDLTRECIKILGIYFSYNSSLAGDKNFMDSVANIEQLLAIWSQRSLTIAGRIQVFNSLAVSKILYVADMNLVPIRVIEQIQKIQKKFIWNGKKPKIKHTTLINEYQDGGLKDVDIEAKIRSLQLGWVRRLFVDDYHPWKIIPLNVLKNLVGKISFIVILILI